MAGSLSQWSPYSRTAHVAFYFDANCLPLDFGWPYNLFKYPLFSRENFRFLAKWNGTTISHVLPLTASLLTNMELNICLLTHTVDTSLPTRAQSLHKPLV